MSSAMPPKILVMGAGAVGCYLGGVLHAAGLPVLFVGRERILRDLRQTGLRISDLSGRNLRISPDDLLLATEVPKAFRPDITLLCVKSGATEETAKQLQQTLPIDSLLLSMQNGMRNAVVARAAAPSLAVRAGMVPFNVATVAPAHFHRGTAGSLAVQWDGAFLPLVEAFDRQGIRLVMHADLREVQWGKLLLNLNNPVNALSGLPLRAQLLERSYRKCLAALQEEALSLLALAAITPAQLAAVSPRVLPKLLRLPNPLFKMLASRMLKIDVKARSSMADDLAAGRLTEIDELCGEVVRLAESIGKAAPLNQRMTELVKNAGTRPRAYSPLELETALMRAG